MIPGTQPCEGKSKGTTQWLHKPANCPSYEMNCWMMSMINYPKNEMIGRQQAEIDEKKGLAAATKCGKLRKCDTVQQIRKRHTRAAQRKGPVTQNRGQSMLGIRYLSTKVPHCTGLPKTPSWKATRQWHRTKVAYWLKSLFKFLLLCFNVCLHLFFFLTVPRLKS